jgi:hypothetical protein
MGATAEDHALHARLLAGDPTASAVVAERYLTAVIEALEWAFPKVDEVLRWTAASDAILAYVEAPGAYDPGARSLAGYLKMAARGDLLNELDRLKRRPPHENLEDHVELAGARRNREEDTPEIEQALIDEDFWDKLEAHVTDPTERAVLELMMEGERETAAFAVAMGISGLDVEEQRTEVKRMKDKVKARIRRRGRDEFS